MTVFQTVLGENFAAIPRSLQDLHLLKHERWQGEANVQTGRNPLAKIAAIIVGLNIKAGQHPLTVTFQQKGENEIWERNFDGRTFRSRYTIGQGRCEGYAIESFGVIKIALALVQDKNRLYFIPRQCTILGLKLPQLLIPKGESYEHETDGKFHFNVTIKLPLIGLIAAYQGWLEPQMDFKTKHAKG